MFFFIFSRNRVTISRYAFQMKYENVFMIKAKGSLHMRSHFNVCLNLCTTIN